MEYIVIIGSLVFFGYIFCHCIGESITDWEIAHMKRKLVRERHKRALCVNVQLNLEAQQTMSEMIQTANQYKNQDQSEK